MLRNVLYSKNPHTGPKYWVHQFSEPVKQPMPILHNRRSQGDKPCKVEEKTSEDCQLETGMAVNLTRIGREQLLNQVQKYPEKMTEVVQALTFQVQSSLQGASEEIPDLIIVCSETQQVLTHR